MPTETLPSSGEMTKDTVYHAPDWHRRQMWIHVTLNDAESITLRAQMDEAGTKKSDRVITVDDTMDLIPVPPFMVVTWADGLETPPVFTIDNAFDR